MKHYLILIFSTFLISTPVLAQSPPQSFTYQKVIKLISIKQIHQEQELFV